MPPLGRAGGHEPAARDYLGDYERAIERDDAYAVAMMDRHGIDDDARQTLDDISRTSVATRRA